MDLIDVYRTFHPKITEYSYFLSAHGTFSRIDHILGHKSGLNRHQKIEIIPCIFSDHSALKLELNHKKNFGRNSNTWKLKTTSLRMLESTRKSKKNLNTSWKPLRMKILQSKTYGI